MAKYIVSFSGGKDSTAMLLLLLEQNKPIDEVVFFDAGSWEFPEMTDHVNRVEKYTGVKITRLQPKKSFDYWFSEHVLQKGKRAGTIGYGFPSMTRRWCTREKIRTINNYIGKHEAVYIGYAFDEKHRVKKQEMKAKNAIYPLIENEITEKQALAMCYEHGFDWGGLYQYFNRVSCWCCPMQRTSELRKLYHIHPELWVRLQEMQDISWNSFKMDYTRIEDFAKRFEAEKLQLSLFPDCFEKAKAGRQKNKLRANSTNVHSKNECSTCS